MRRLKLGVSGFTVTGICMASGLMGMWRGWPELSASQYG